MQIKVDFGNLTQEQREAIAGFILAYPAAQPAVPACIHKDTADEALVEVGKQHPLPDTHGSRPLDEDAAKINAIFGQGSAGPTFADVGIPPPPLPVAPAPFTVAADPSRTAQEDTQAPTFPWPFPPASEQFALPTVPAAPAPSAPAAPPSPAGAGSLDSKGLPWDARIHSSKRTQNADGSWRVRKGVNAFAVAQVETQLRQGVETGPFVLQAAPAPTAAATAAATTAATAPPPPVEDARAQFVALIGRTSAALQTGKITQPEINQICTESGVQALPLLANRQDLIPTVASRIDALIAARSQ